jgi:Ser/Thr protein kinase RdoA (MazF antagonist)
VDLSAWGSPEPLSRLGGGHRNEVFRVAGDLVARRSRRSAASLDWELDLLAVLADHGFVVAEVVPAQDGRRHVDGVVVQRWLPGRAPVASDWPLVTAELRRLHTLLAGWPQRPGFCSTRDLLSASRGGDVDLTAMPADVVAACRTAWSALTGSDTVVHGDPCAPNLRIDGDRVGFLDWDESRVDHPWLDLADLPDATLPPAARAAIDAWEVANAWQAEPDYARTRLATLLLP